METMTTSDQELVDNVLKVLVIVAFVVNATWGDKNLKLKNIFRSHARYEHE